MGEDVERGDVSGEDDDAVGRASLSALSSLFLCCHQLSQRARTNFFARGPPSSPLQRRRQGSKGQ